MKIIFEWRPKSGIWVLIPTVMLFERQVVDREKGDNIDLTFAFVCIGITLRFK